ncbi:zinc finger protein 37 homolog [Sabethes cyaneus]|uniref:zinc finger protein 37 homolog n=1 Tax=Sabethes cyaneus TaxID=53552 RepID=UPI00237EB636|nr:zinc finger protein 37 homolog [Sabethes cyaneus]
MSAVQCDYELDIDLNHVCRICVSQTDTNEHMFNIFSNIIVDGFLAKLPDIILFCVDIKVVRKNGISCKICQNCRETLLKFYVFKQKCQRTEQLLQQAIPTSDGNNRIAVNSAEASDETQVGLPLKLDEEIVEFLDEANFYHTQATSDESNSETNQHRQSDENFESSSGNPDQYSGKHCETESLSISIANNDQDNREREPELQLNDKMMVRLNADEAHTIDAHSSAFSKHCDTKEYLQEVSSKDHEKLNNNLLICTTCGRKINGKMRLLRHMRQHEGSANIIDVFMYYICEICKMVFLKRDKLSDHLRLNEHPMLTKDNNNDKPYNCSVCSEKHCRLDDMKQHILSHLKHFSCPFDGCGCEYSSSARLANHINSKHIEYESYKCCHCGSDKFESMFELQEHLRKKCTEKKFHCHHCDKKFSTSRSLAQHLRCLEKRHCCIECGKFFAQPGELTLHLRTHNGDRPF